jgi:glycosyltransferase involved in cell wall biosynthesis
VRAAGGSLAARPDGDPAESARGGGEGPLRILLVSGIWPPDVGGPASHAPELASFLQARGHRVEVVTTAAAAPAPRPYPVRWVSRRLPAGLRHGAVALLVARRARRADVVYATSMVARAALGAALARRPLVVKLTTDEAFERALRWGLCSGDLDAFQATEGGLVVGLLRRLRSAALARAARIVCPSEYLAALVPRWGVPAASVAVVANPLPPLSPLPSAEEARRALRLDGPLLAFAGRMSRQKALASALEALAQVEGVVLVAAGDGPERPTLEQRAQELGLAGRVRFLGPLPREKVLLLFRAADATLLASAWENFPHAVVESLAVGTPVIATRVGGLAELVEDGVNGLLVPPGDVQALAAAIRRFFAEAGLRERLARAARLPAGLEPEAAYGRIEALLREAVGR